MPDCSKLHTPTDRVMRSLGRTCPVTLALLTKRVKTHPLKPSLVGTTVNGARLVCNSRYSPHRFYALDCCASWRQRIDSAVYNVLRAN
jgi:hypothetical protein